LCDVLLAAAYADDHLHAREKEEVRGMISDLAGGMPPEVDARIAAFDPGTFDLDRAVAPFRDDTLDERKQLLVLASAVVEADDELDLAEDEFLCKLADTLRLPASALEGLTVEIEEEALHEAFEQVRRGPPPPPNKRK
jgi:uncharacterized tellurite resistance protein B-like protein